MITATIQTSDTLVVLQCGECGVRFALPEALDKQHREKGTGWYCPNGHARVYAELASTKLEKELARERQKLDQAKADADYWRGRHGKQIRTASYLKGRITRERNRAAKGLCPCCGQHFDALQSHMAEKHPEYKGDDAQLADAPKRKAD